MRMGFGRYKDKEVGWVLLQDPEYVKWMFAEKVHPEILSVMRQMIVAFDKKPIQEKCIDSECTNYAMQLSLYTGHYTGDYYFCDTCSPYGKGARSGTLTTIRTYQEALAYRDADRIVKSLAEAKGAPSRKTAGALVKFFGM